MCTQNGPLNLQFHKVNHRIVSWQEGAAPASNFTSLLSGLLSFAGGRDIGHLEIIISSFHLEPFECISRDVFCSILGICSCTKSIPGLKLVQVKTTRHPKKNKSKNSFSS